MDSIRKLAYEFLINILRIRYLHHVAKFIAYPFLDYRQYIDILSYSKENQVRFLFYENQVLHFSRPVFNILHKDPSDLLSKTGFSRYAVTLDSVEVIGGSSLLLLKKKKVIYDIFNNDFSNKFRYTDRGILYHSREFCVVASNKNDDSTHKKIEEGIFMGGNFSWNYYHLLFEILVRFELIIKCALPKRLPLLIDEVCVSVPQYYHLINLLNKDFRELIILKRGKRYFVRKLYYFSCPNLIPPNFNYDVKIESDDVLFNLSSLKYLHNSLLPSKSKSIFPSRLFISRSKASSRRKYNEDEIYDLLKNFEFQKVHPEDYSIPDQIALFHDADYIVGGSGAAFSNVLFCRNSCKILIFSNYKVPFSGFSTIADYFGSNLTYFTADDVDNYNTLDLHKDFLINPNSLEVFVRNWIT